MLTQKEKTALTNRTKPSIHPNSLVRHELVGLEVEIVSSTNESQAGAKGVVTDETRQTLTIEVDSGRGKKAERSFAKDQCVFRFTLPSGEKVRVGGSILVARPEDRVKKKLRKW